MFFKAKVGSDETLEFHVYKIQGGYNILGVNYETYLKHRTSIDKTLAKINPNSEKDYRDNIRCPKILKNKEGIFNLMIFPENIMSCLRSNRVIFLTDKLNAINIVFALEAVEESDNKLYKLSKAYVNGSSWNLENVYVNDEDIIDNITTYLDEKPLSCTKGDVIDSLFANIGSSLTAKDLYGNPSDQS